MKHRCRSSASFARDRDGAVTIEFVVTLPLFLVALAFAFEFGQIFLAHQSTVNNVRAASRYLSRTAVTPANLACAQDIVRTGRMVLSAGACAAPAARGELPATPHFRQPELLRTDRPGSLRHRRVEFPPLAQILVT